MANHPGEAVHQNLNNPFADPAFPGDQAVNHLGIVLDHEDAQRVAVGKIPRTARRSLL
jgi:hypothetical protein